MKLKNIKLKVAILLVFFMLCTIVSPFSKSVNAALANHVTGDDIINTGLELVNPKFTYSNIGTCTGFVTRVLMHLKVGLPLVSRNSNWNYCYTEEGWNQPGYIYTAAWGPDDFYSQAMKMVNNGEAIFIGHFTKADVAARASELMNGDLIVTRPQDRRPYDGSGHVAFVHIHDGNIYSLGAGAGVNGGVSDSLLARGVVPVTKQSLQNIDVPISEIDPYNVGNDDDYNIFRLVEGEPTEDFRLFKVDSYGENVEGVKFRISGEKLDEPLELVTDAEGKIELLGDQGLKPGDYVAEEIEVPTNMIKKEGQIPFTIVKDTENTLTVENRYQTGNIELQKLDLLDDNQTRGDATFKDAEYTIYAREDIKQGKTTVFQAGKVAATMYTNIEGYAVSTDLPIGKYYVVETKAPKGYELDPTTYDVEIVYNGQDSETATIPSIISKDEPINGRARVTKWENKDDDSSEKSPAAGAVLRMTLISSKTSENPDGLYYEIKLDDNGEGEFIDQDFHEKHPEEDCTIPYGTYEIKEIVEPSGEALTDYFIKPITFELTENNKLYPFLVVDEVTDSYIRIIKKDEYTKEVVKKVGAKFKIWDVEEGKFVEFMEPLSGKPLTELEATEEGYVNTPSELTAGKTYRIYETAAPEGYLINPKYALPDKSELGKKNGLEFTVDKPTIGAPVELIYDQNQDLILQVTIEDPRPMVQLKIYKTGEMFTNISQTNAPKPIEDSGAQLYEPVFTKEKLPGVTFNVITTERVLNPDKSGNYVEAGTVVDTFVTNEDGIGTSVELFPGTYKVVEVDVPTGTVLDTTGVTYTLENDGKETPVKVYEKELTNVRQKLGLTFPKRFDEVKFRLSEDEEEPQATFAVYASEAIQTVKNNKEIPKNGLVDVITVTGNGDVTTNIDLPEGKYYVKEVAASFPYTINPEQIDFELRYGQDKTKEYNIANGETFVNTPESGTVTLIKISSSSMKSVLIDGNQVDKDSYQEELKEMINKFQNMTKEEVKKYFEDNGIKSIAGATYGIYLDEECTQILQILNETTNEFEDAKIVTDESGMISLENIPVGEYYVKELIAPEGYDLSEEAVKVIVTKEESDGTVYTALVDDGVITRLFNKTDIFTGDVVPDCVFEILDENGEQILNSKTPSRIELDKNGKEIGHGYIPVDALENGKTYYLHEISAPEEYDLNPEYHKFVASYDEEKAEWTGEDINITNTRKSKEVRILKIDEETGEPLQGCVFSIALLDEDGNIKTREDGSTVYLVENAVTDENGEYIIEKAYYGTYKFTEVQAPENYELSEKDMEGYVFTVDGNSPDRIDFIITNTGDIAVIAIAVVAVLCVIGIVFVIVRNKKSTK